jgi:hypothetical protein
VPLGLDSTISLDLEYRPLQTWRRTVEQWGASLALQNFRRARGSSLTIMQRAVEPNGEDDIECLPRFPLTKLANHGPDQIRLRLLSGTSALNSKLTKWKDRAPSCPFDNCHGTCKEDAQHFLLHCRGVKELRTQYRGQLKRHCYCNPAESCDKFFTQLDDAGRALFMLGGPVNGHTPEASIDACSRRFVRDAWDARCAVLTSQNPEPTVVDLTAAGSGRAHGQQSDGSVSRSVATSKPHTTPTTRSNSITAYFSRTPTEGPRSNLIATHPSRSPTERSRIAQSTSTTTRANVSEPRRRLNGSGPYVPKDKGCG